MKKFIVTAIVAAALMFTGVLYAQARGTTQKPQVDVSAAKHPNIAAAQKLAQQAWDKVAAAQKANEFDLGGHAQKAKELLDQASKELKLAAEAANKK